MKQTQYSEADLVAAKMWARFLNLTTYKPKSVQHTMELLAQCEYTGTFIESILVRAIELN